MQDWDAATLAALGQRLAAAARARHHRLTLVLAGGHDWTLWAALTVWRGAATGAMAKAEALWLTDRAVPAPSQALDTAEQLLGRELDGLVYDAHGGLDPDGFGAATGALRGGGLLLLLTPPLAAWPRLADPQAERIAVHPFTAADVAGRFLARFVRVLRTSPGCWVVEQHVPLPAGPAPGEAAGAARPAPGSDPPSSPAIAATEDQRRAIAAIIATARGRARRPLVISADRGRGKSAALGLAAAELLAAGAGSILVTAPRRTAVAALFHHAAAALPGARDEGEGLVFRDQELAFRSPDALIEQAPPAGLLLIDEAAGIPAPLLERALRRYPRVVFATTIHGYEGTGRGFEVRFRDTLDRLAPSWRALRLTQPIRWAAGDPLEALTSRALLLAATPAADAEAAAVGPGAGRCQVLDRDRLADDEPTLAALFGLLVLAHYQTRPLDLRHLLDGPNVAVQVLRQDQTIVATLLGADEGGFDAALAEAIFAGRRRPRGHLLPQTLAAHAGLADAPRLRYRRIVRLAVHPAARGRGHGRRLVEAAIAASRTAGLDLIGASFGATPELLRFWSRCGFAPAQLGTRRNAASGEHALVVLRPLTAAGAALADTARRRLARRLPPLLAGPLRDASPRLIAALLAELPGDRPDPDPLDPDPLDLDPLDRRELAAFVDQLRSLEASLPALAALAAARIGPTLRAGHVTADQAELLVHAILQRHDPAETAVAVGASGRAEVIARLREAAGVLWRAGPLPDEGVSG